MGVQARSAQFVTLGDSMQVVRVSPTNRKVVHPAWLPQRCVYVYTLALPYSGLLNVLAHVSHLFGHPARATLPAEGRRRRDGLDWWPAKGPRRPPGPGPPRTLPARSSPRLSSAPAQDAVEGPATDSTPGLDPRARPRGDPDTLRRCGHLDHLSDHRDPSLERMSQHDCQLVSPTAGALGGTRTPSLVIRSKIRNVHRGP